MKKKFFLITVACLFIGLFLNNVRFVKAAAEERESKSFVTYDIETEETTTEVLKQNRLVINSIPGSMGNAPQTRSIIGDTDERQRIYATTSYPYSTICYLRTYWNDGTHTNGTGFMVSRDQVSTAAHCLYDPDRGGFAKGVRVWPGMAGPDDTGYGPIDAIPTSITVWTDYINQPYHNWSLDAGILTLKTPIGDETGWLACVATTGNIAGTNIYVTGYPGDHRRELWRCLGQVVSTTDFRLNHNADTMAGESGSPIYRKYSGTGWTAIGIHNCGGVVRNIGYRIDGDYLSLITMLIN